MCIVFFKQNTAYEMRISDWSSDVCSADLIVLADENHGRKSSAPGSSVQHAVYLVNDRLAAACKLGSTARRQTGILMGVHSVPPWRAKDRKSTRLNSSH